MKKKNIKLVLKKTNIAKIGNTKKIVGGTGASVICPNGTNSFESITGSSNIQEVCGDILTPDMPETATPACLDSIVVCYQDTIPVFG